MNHRTAEQSCAHSSRHAIGQAGASGGALDDTLLREQNRHYRDTGGVSCNNRNAGFVPGYLNASSGTAVLSRFANGRPAPVHVLDGLPPEWVAERDADGAVLRTCPSVIAGFIRNGRFYSRAEAARALQN